MPTEDQLRKPPRENSRYSQPDGFRAESTTGKAELFAWELYDMETDRTEMHDLAGEHPEKVAELAEK